MYEMCMGSIVRIVGLLETRTPNIKKISVRIKMFDGSKISYGRGLYTIRLFCNENK